MYFLKGKIISVFNNRIVIETNCIGYEIFVARPIRYLVGEDRLVYTYKHVHEDKSFLIGFDSLEEKEMFMLLIEVNGLGPRTALTILEAYYPDDIYSAIVSNNTAFFKRIPGIGSKCAAQIILDLHGKLAGKKGNPNMFNEVYATLRELGFKKGAIDAALAEINLPNATNEEILKEALRKLRP